MPIGVKGTTPPAHRGTSSFRSRNILLLLMAICMFFHRLRAQNEVPAPEVILEVNNQHWTVGQQIPSAYLSVLSDGTVECHTLKFTGHETDVVKKRVLTPDELHEVKAVVMEPDLLQADKKYWLTRGVVDSWMEWNIRIPRRDGTQEIVIANFLPTTRAHQGPYPDAVVRLGCLISQLRDEVYGDDAFRHHKCQKILDAK